MLKFNAELIGADQHGAEYAVWVTSSKGGNDRALLAVFGAREGAQELAEFFTRLVAREAPAPALLPGQWDGPNPGGAG